jgi:hypothetical protein
LTEGHKDGDNNPTYGKLHGFVQKNVMESWSAMSSKALFNAKNLQYSRSVAERAGDSRCDTA